MNSSIDHKPCRDASIEKKPDILSAREREGVSQVEVLNNSIVDISNEENIQIEITLDRAIRVRVPGHSIQVCVSNTGNATAVFHPNGRPIQNTSRIDLVEGGGEEPRNFTKFIWIAVGAAIGVGLGLYVYVYHKHHPSSVVIYNFLNWKQENLVRLDRIEN